MFRKSHLPGSTECPNYKHALALLAKDDKDVGLFFPAMKSKDPFNLVRIEIGNRKLAHNRKSHVKQIKESLTRLSVAFDSLDKTDFNRAPLIDPEFDQKCLSLPANLSVELIEPDVSGGSGEPHSSLTPSPGRSDEPDVRLVETFEKPRQQSERSRWARDRLRPDYCMNRSRISGERSSKSRERSVDSSNFSSSSISKYDGSAESYATTDILSDQFPAVSPNESVDIPGSFTMSDTRFSQSDTRFVKSDTGFDKSDIGFDKSDIGFDQSDTMFRRTDSRSHWSLESIYGSVDRHSEGSDDSESVRRRKPSLSDNIRSNQPATKPDSSDKTPRDPELPQRKSFMSDTFRHFADLMGDLSISDPASSNYEYVEPGRCQKVESDKCQKVESDTKQPDTPIASQFRYEESKEE
eukprot:49019_1